MEPQVSEDTIWINQDAWFSLAEIEPGQQVIYTKKSEDNGVYFFVINGVARIEDHVVHRRDGLGLVDGEIYTTASQTTTLVLAIEIPVTV